MYVYFWHFLVVFINIQDTLTGTVLHTNSFMFCHILWTLLQFLWDGFLFMWWYVASMVLKKWHDQLNSGVENMTDDQLYTSTRIENIVL